MVSSRSEGKIGPKSRKEVYLGMGLALLGALLWGLSGTCVQFLENQRHVNMEWLVTVRLFVAGCINVAWVLARHHLSDLTKIFFQPRDLGKFIIFSLLGVSLCQYTYFRAIAVAGVGLATVIQYTAPTLIIIYLFLRYRKIPNQAEVLAVVLAFIGTLCIVFQGQPDLASLNGPVLFWGLISAASIGVYTLQPVSLLAKYGTGPILGLAMVLGGLVAKLVWFDAPSHMIWDAWTWVALFGIVVLGTVVSFNAFMEGIRRVGPVRGVILSSLEPISAALFGWALLGNQLTSWDLAGFVLIVTTVLILGFAKQKQ